MRIIAGKYKARRIYSLTNNRKKTTPGKYSGYRPTTDRARESLFDILSNRIDFTDKTCTDLFAGSGSLGFEALSRGAKFCTFVDISKACCRNILQTAQSLECEANIESVCLDALFFLKNDDSYADIIFADPPYRYDLQYELLNLMLKRNASTLVLETDEELQPESTGEYNILRRTSGKTNFTILNLE